MAKAKKKKEKIEKSIVAFDVKVHNEDEDFDALWTDIVAIQKEGLTWNQNFELIEVAFGMQKIRMSMVIVDDLIGVDELYEEIE